VSGFNWWTGLALLAGLIVHTLKAAAQLQPLTWRRYWKTDWLDWTAGPLCALALWFSHKELSDAMPDLAKAVGVIAKPTLLSSFVCGYLGDSLADLLSLRLGTRRGP
jgi:hypothetical protein